jgi:hypothetical protein
MTLLQSPLLVIPAKAGIHSLGETGEAQLDTGFRRYDEVGEMAVFP